MHTRGFKLFLVLVVLACAALLKFRSGNQKLLQLPIHFRMYLLWCWGWHRMPVIRRLDVTKPAATPTGKERKKKTGHLPGPGGPAFRKILVNRCDTGYHCSVKKSAGLSSCKTDYSPDGIFLTHAHTGHYTGLLQLGREAMGTNGIPVYAMSRMDSFLRNNGPWNQLVQLKNITLNGLKEDSL